MADFGKIAVALQVSRHRLENDLIKLRRLCEHCGLSDMGTTLAVEGFENDILMVDEAVTLLREMSRYEGDVLDLIARKNGQAVTWLDKVLDTARMAVF